MSPTLAPTSRRLDRRYILNIAFPPRKKANATPNDVPPVNGEKYFKEQPPTIDTKKPINTPAAPIEYNMEMSDTNDFDITIYPSISPFAFQCVGTFTSQYGRHKL